RGNPACAEHGHGQAAGRGDLLHQPDWRLEALGPAVQLGRIGLGDGPQVGEDGPPVAHRLHDVARARLALGPAHGRRPGAAAAGTRSRAITDTAPASSAILACSGVTTSMMTPPRSISARPRLTRSVPVVRSVMGRILRRTSLYRVVVCAPMGASMIHVDPGRN